MRPVTNLPRLLLILGLAGLGLTGLDPAPRDAFAKVQIEQPEKQTDGDPEDFTDAPERISPTVAKPPTQPVNSRVKKSLQTVLRTYILIVFRSLAG